MMTVRAVFLFLLLQAALPATGLPSSVLLRREQDPDPDPQEPQRGESADAGSESVRDPAGGDDDSEEDGEKEAKSPPHAKPVDINDIDDPDGPSSHTDSERSNENDEAEPDSERSTKGSGNDPDPEQSDASDSGGSTGGSGSTKHSGGSGNDEDASDSSDADDSTGGSGEPSSSSSKQQSGEDETSGKKDETSESSSKNDADIIDKMDQGDDDNENVEKPSKSNSKDDADAAKEKSSKSNSKDDANAVKEKSSESNSKDDADAVKEKSTESNSKDDTDADSKDDQGDDGKASLLELTAPKHHPRKVDQSSTPKSHPKHKAHKHALWKSEEESNAVEEHPHHKGKHPHSKRNKKEHKIASMLEAEQDRLDENRVTMDLETSQEASEFASAEDDGEQAKPPKHKAKHHKSKKSGSSRGVQGPSLIEEEGDAFDEESAPVRLQTYEENSESDGDQDAEDHMKPPKHKAKHHKSKKSGPTRSAQGPSMIEEEGDAFDEDSATVKLQTHEENSESDGDQDAEVQGKPPKHKAKHHKSKKSGPTRSAQSPSMIEEEGDAFDEDRSAANLQASDESAEFDGDHEAAEQTKPPKHKAKHHKNKKTGPARSAPGPSMIEEEQDSLDEDTTSAIVQTFDEVSGDDREENVGEQKKPPNHKAKHHKNKKSSPTRSAQRPSMIEEEDRANEDIEAFEETTESATA